MENEYSDASSIKAKYSKFSADVDLPMPTASQSSFDFKATKKTDYTLVENLIGKLHEIDTLITRKIDIIESLDISINIITYKVYEATHEFKDKISEIKAERNKLLTSVENRSELSLIVHDLDRKISDLETGLEENVADLNCQKIEFQGQIESLITQLDDDVSLMQEKLKQLKRTLDAERGVAYRSQLLLINEKYNPHVEKAEKHLQHFERLQLTGWRLENSELQLSKLLEEQGIKFTKSARLLTKGGSLMTFDEAQEKGYFRKIHMSLEKMYDLFRQQHESRTQVMSGDQLQPHLEQDSVALSESTSIESRLSSEDVKYLKQYVGRPLTLALAEITAKQPRDPIHYLGHYLFKYRYNQELEEVQKMEIDELTRERKRVAEEKWKNFVEAEARNAVMDMIMQAEQIAYQNELRRIEQEQMLAQEEEEEGDEEYKKFLEEARDKFE